MNNKMARPMTVKQENNDIKDTPEVKNESINKELEDGKSNRELELENEIAELKKMMDAFVKDQKEKSEPSPIINMNVSKMDTPCTLIHLCECTPGLNTTIYVNSIPHVFSKFGEKRVFRFADMQYIVSRYRDWFSRGVFALANDCSQFENDFGIEVLQGNTRADAFNKIAVLSIKEFEAAVKDMNLPMRIVFANYWTHQYEVDPGVYGNIDKVKILNEYTDRFIQIFLESIILK